ncbi:MAG: hypothetical protein JSU70_06165, partial [Phycisphaerales bacterium]
SYSEIREIVQGPCTEPPPGDANGDCIFDCADLDILFENWLTCTLPVPELCGPGAPEPPTPPRR